MERAFLCSVSMVVVGCNHQSAPLALLERLAIPAGELAELLASLKQRCREVVALSTCNRTELYAVCGHAASGSDILLRVLAERAGASPDELRASAYVHAGSDAVRHAFAVASGLDSMVLGEDQIQSQWKRALAHARAADAVGPVLDRLGASALSCGKRVRTFTGVGRHSVSLESLAVRAAAERLGLAGFEGRRVLVIGAGESAALVVRHLRADADPRITVMTRSPDRAEAFAQLAGVEHARIDAIGQAVVAADAIFCCTAAPHPVLGHAHFEAWGEREPGRPLVCVDLGMPRDIEEAVSHISGVQLVNIAELSALADRHRQERRGHLPAAEAIVAAEVARFLAWKSARGSAAAITRLHAHARQLAALELDVALARLAHLPARDREIVASMAHRMVSKLMHAPTVALREHPEADNIALALEFAFGLDGAREALHGALPHDTDAPAASEPIQETA